MGRAIRGSWLAAAALLAVGAGCGGAFAGARAAPGAAEPAPPPRPAGRAQVRPTAAFELDRPGWWRAEVEVQASADEAPREASERALALARRTVVEAAAGVSVRSGVLSFESLRGSDSSQLAQALTLVRSEAFIVDERSSPPAIAPAAEGGGYRLGLALEARVVDRRKSSDPGFEVELRVGSGDGRRLVEGDRVELSVRSTRDARVYLVCIHEGGATLLVPNEHLPEARAGAGEWLAFPGPALAARGVEVRAMLPAGRRSAIETLVAVAVKGDRGIRGLRPAAGGVFREEEARSAGRLLGDVLGPLAALDPSEWAWDHLAYEVVGR